MSVSSIIRRVCEPCRALIHRTRAQSVEDVAEAIARGGRLSPVCIGRSIQSRAMPKHSIKRVDRLLGNSKLHKDRWLYWRTIAQHVLGNSQHPIVLIDWSGTVKGMHTLAAATPIGGRAVTLYAEVWPEDKYANRKVQRQFLRTLQKVLGHERQPIIVADAGFRAPFMHALNQIGWPYVIRVRGPVYVRADGSNDWVKSTDLHAAVSSKPASLGVYRITRERSQYVTPAVDARLVLARKPPRASRKRRHSPAPVWGTRGGTGILAAAKEPWLLATTLEAAPETIVAIYAMRMQIEETFRDHKSHRYGWCMRHVQSKCPRRLATLLMLAAIAMLAVTVIGLKAEQQRLHRQYQSNTSTQRVLSWFALGRALIARSDRRITATKAIHKLFNTVRPTPALL